MKKEKVLVLDTTLRDGEQASGFHMYGDEKFILAQRLAEAGVDIIEAGNPVSSPGEYRAVRRISECVDGPIIAGLARCDEKDIIEAGKAIEPAAKRGKGRIHIFLPTSDIHTEKKLRKSKQEIIDMAVRGIKKAREFTDDVQYSSEDFARSDPAYIIDVATEAVNAGAITINLPDTVGFITPFELRYMFKETIEAVNKRIGNRKARFGGHCHNDLGLATANTIAAILGGARQLEVTMNGIGERAGNAALEEVIAIIREKPEFFERETGSHIYTSIDTRYLMDLSKIVSKFTGSKPQRNKAIVGENAFSHESGVHQDGMLKDSRTYEWMKPGDYGNESKLTFGPRSGRKGLKEIYRKKGMEFSEKELDGIYKRFVEIADNEKEINDYHLAKAFSGKEMEPSYKLLSIKMWAYNSGGEAEICLRCDNKEYTAKASGDGMTNAAFKAMNSVTGIEMYIEDVPEPVYRGSDVMGKKTILASNNGFEVKGYGLDTDTVRGTIKAYIDAANKMRFVMETMGSYRI